MNENLKYGLYFLGGLAVGALGTVAVSRGGVNLKPVATQLISHGLDMKDAVLGKVETVKEGMEDLVAEAQYASEQRKEQREEQHQAGPVQSPEAC